MESAAPGEFELIARLTGHLATREGVVLGVGDDCAILDMGGGNWLLATCDSQVEGVHFTLQGSSPEQIGRRALAVNLSDIAAMGGEPRYALVSLILPRRFPVAVLDGIYTGLRQEAERYTTALVGGNIASAGAGEPLVIDITLLGAVERGHALLRSGARVGDTIFVTGSLGDAAAGLYTLLYPDQRYPEQAREMVRASQRTPRPRVHEGRMLSCLGPQIVTALIDVSDGLSGDLGHLCERSKVGARIEANHLPLSPALRAIAASAGCDALAFALHGGEDYELLFTVAPGCEEQVSAALQAATGTPVTAIGTILPASAGMRLVSLDGREEMLAVRSWDHLKPS